MGLLIIILKSVTVYFAIVIGIRIFGKRELSQLSVADLVFILLISNSVQNAMVGDNTTLVGGLSAALGLFVINYIFKSILNRNKKIRELFEGEKILLLNDGVINAGGMRRAMITVEDLKRCAREHGILRLEDVAIAILEVDGNISIIPKELENKKTSKNGTNKHQHDTTLFQYSGNRTGGKRKPLHYRRPRKAKED